MATLYFSNQNVLVKNLKSRVGSIEGKIPSAASTDNQLADKAYVDTSLSDHISSLTAAFNGSYATYADLSAATGMNKNDYAVVLADESHNNECWRYKYDGAEWKAEYRVNETALTTEQNNALNSGITAETVSNLNSIVPDTATSDNKLATVNDITALSSSTAGNLDSKMDKNNPSGNGVFSLFKEVDELGLQIKEGSTTYASDNALFRIRSDNNSTSRTDESLSAFYIEGLPYKLGDRNEMTVRHDSDDPYQSHSTQFTVFRNGDAEVQNNLYLGGTLYINTNANNEPTSISDFIKKNSSLKFTGTIKAGDNRLEFTSSSIEEDMFVNVYASQYGVMPDSVIVEAGRVLLSFDEALPANVTFGVRLESFGPNEDGTDVVSSNYVIPSDDPNT